MGEDGGGARGLGEGVNVCHGRRWLGTCHRIHAGLAFPYVRPVQKCVLSPFWTIGWWWVVESSPRRMNESGDSPPVPLKVVVSSKTFKLMRQVRGELHVSEYLHIF